MLVIEANGVIMIENYDTVGVFIGGDVGKSDHDAVALDRTGKTLFDRACPTMSPAGVS